MNENETTKDLTENLTDRQLLLLLLERVARLEAAEEERARETRPLWHRLDGQVTTLLDRVEVLTVRVDKLTADVQEIKEEVKEIGRDIDVLHEDMRHEKRARAKLAERVAALENDREAA